MTMSPAHTQLKLCAPNQATNEICARVQPAPGCFIWQLEVKVMDSIIRTHSTISVQAISHVIRDHDNLTRKNLDLSLVMHINQPAIIKDLNKSPS